MTERPGDLQANASRAGSRISPVVRITGLVLGFALAIAATLAVFLTDNALYLRLAVIAVAWAFVIAAFSAGRRKTDQAVAEGRENELRQAYALELEREVAARREYELKLENQLRREAQEAMRAELDGLRADLASLAGLRDQIMGLGELRADVGRLRHELTEQLNGEMLVERIVMRTQSIRMPSERAELGAGDPRLLEAAPAWEHDEESRSVPAPEPERVQRTGPPPVPAEFSALRPDPAPEPRSADAGRAPTPFDWLGPRGRSEEPFRSEAPSRHASPVQDDRVGQPGGAARHGTAEQPAVSSQPPPPPASAPSSTPLWGESAPAPREQPAAPAPGPAPDPFPTGGHRAPVELPPPPAEPEREPDEYETAGHQRLTEILAESGSTAGGGRRRRRYRDDDEPADDVLSRVLGSRDPTT